MEFVYHIQFFEWPLQIPYLVVIVRFVQKYLPLQNHSVTVVHLELSKQVILAVTFYQIPL